MENTSSRSQSSATMNGTLKIKKEWKDVAGKFANASPAVKQALRTMREARDAN